MLEMRPLLGIGNGKLGEGIHSWSLPAVQTCPGRSTACESVCYSNNKGRYRFAQVKQRLEWNWQQAQMDDFVDRMVAEIGRKGVQVLRLHCSGDFATVGYAEKWLAVMRKKPKPRYYFYSRSWRVAEIAPVLEQMAMLKCCRAWYSTDSETSIPPVIPRGVRLAYLQLEEGEEPELLDLRFTVKKLRKKQLSLPMLCPHEQKVAQNCGDCGKCFR